MDIKLPKSLKELRQYHLEAVSKLEEDYIDIYDKLSLCVELTGLDMDLLKRVPIKNINIIINHYLDLIGKADKKEPKKNIKVGGIEYKLISSISDQPLSWHMDISAFDIQDSSIVAAFCYIEKGKEYCEMDKRKNVLNPVKVRAANFRDNLPASDHIDLGFFLQKKLTNYSSASMEIRNQRKKLDLKLQKKKSPTIGKEASTQ